MIILRQNSYSEGKHTKKVRRTSDIVDVVLPTAISAGIGAMGGGSIANNFGKSGKKGALIGATAMGSVSAAKSLNKIRKRKKKDRETPDKLTKPEELKQGINPIGTVAGSALLGYTTYKGAVGYGKSEQYGYVNKKIKDIAKRAEKGEDLSEDEMKFLYAFNNDPQKVISGLHDKIGNSNKTKVYKKVIAPAVVGATILGTNAADHIKYRRLKKAYEKDKKEQEENNKD